MRNLFIFSGIGVAAYLLFGGHVHAISAFTGTSTFAITNVEQLRPGFPLSSFNMICEYVSRDPEAVTLQSVTLTATVNDKPLAESKTTPNLTIPPGTKHSLNVPVTLSAPELITAARRGSKVKITTQLTLDGDEVTNITEFTI